MNQIVAVRTGNGTYTYKGVRFSVSPEQDMCLYDVWNWWDGNAIGDLGNCIFANYDSRMKDVGDSDDKIAIKLLKEWQEYFRSGCDEDYLLDADDLYEFFGPDPEEEDLLPPAHARWIQIGQEVWGMIQIKEELLDLPPNHLEEILDSAINELTEFILGYPCYFEIHNLGPREFGSDDEECSVAGFLSEEDAVAAAKEIIDEAIAYQETLCREQDDDCCECVPNVCMALSLVGGVVCG